MNEFKHAMNLLQNQDAVLLDVRTYREYCQGHLSEAVLVTTQPPPLSAREEQNLKEQLLYTLRGIPKTRPIVVYCKKGLRAQTAKKVLRSLGYKNTFSLGGAENAPLKNIFAGKNHSWTMCRCVGGGKMV